MEPLVYALFREIFDIKKSRGTTYSLTNATVYKINVYHDKHNGNFHTPMTPMFTMVEIFMSGGPSWSGGDIVLRGFSKRHPNDGWNEEIALRTAIIRALDSQPQVIK